MKTTKAYAGTKTLESMNQAEFYNKWTLKKFEKYLKGDILEVGCGIGNFTSTLAKYEQVTAIDIDQSLIDRFKKDKNFRVTVGYGDIEKGRYFFKDKVFDTVVCLNVLEHINDDIEALQNMYELLKKNGKLILLAPIHDFLYGEIDRSINHFRRYNPDQLKVKLEQIGFTIEESRKLNFLGALGWFVAGRIFKNKQVEDSKVRLFNTIAPFCLFVEDFIEPVFGTSVLIIAKKS